MISNFIGFCKQRGIPIFISTNVESEALGRIRKVVNRIMDERRINAYAIRYKIIRRCEQRLKELLNASKVGSVPNPKISVVRNMYLSNREKLERIRTLKGRTSILPSRMDMKILGEAARLAEQNEVYFVTDDHDFLDFKDEILKMFGVKVVRISELVSLMHALGKEAV